MLKFKKIVIK